MSHRHIEKHFHSVFNLSVLIFSLLPTLASRFILENIDLPSSFQTEEWEVCVFYVCFEGEFTPPVPTTVVPEE